HAPFYYGLKKGFYSAEGIDLTIKAGTGSGTTIQQVDQKNTTFGWADTPVLLNSVAKGMKVKSLGVFLQKGPSSVEYLADHGINRLGTGIVANTDALAANPDLARRFVRATQKSWAEAAKDIPGAVQAMVGMAPNEPPQTVLTKQLTLCLPLLGSGTPGVD